MTFSKISRTASHQHPNAPSGASTAAPVFEDGRLLQLIAFCSLQILDRSLGDLFLLAFDVLHISEVICMFLTFSVISFRGRWLIDA